MSPSRTRRAYAPRLARIGSAGMNLGFALLIITIMMSGPAVAYLQALSVAIFASGVLAYGAGVIAVTLLFHAGLWELMNLPERLIRLVVPLTTLVAAFVSLLAFIVGLVLTVVIAIMTAFDIFSNRKQRTSPDHVPSDWDAH